MEFVLAAMLWFIANGRVNGISGGPRGRYWSNPGKNMGYGAVIETLLDPDHYHKYIRPGIGEGKPINVNITLVVESLDKISDADMEYTVTFTLHQLWRDGRLDGTKTIRGYSKVLTMDGSLGNRIWVPDTYIVNSHTSFIHDVTTRNGLIRLYPNGTVLYVLRITSRVSCPMKLHKYPMDHQTCKLPLSSWSFTEEDLVYSWSKGEKCGKSESLSGLENVVLPQFNITNCSIYHQLKTHELGNYSQLVLEFRLKRNILFFLMQTYLPSILLVILSWVSFWINMDSIPSRVGLGATTILSMTTLMIGVYNSGPKSTSYIKAIDFYVCVCYGFIFLALIEYAWAHFSKRRCIRKANILATEKCRKNRITKTDDSEDHPLNYHNLKGREGDFNNIKDSIIEMYWNGRNDEQRHTSNVENEFREMTAKRRSFPHQDTSTPRQSARNRLAAKWLHSASNMGKIDEFSRVLFPVAFSIYNAVYWWFVLTMEDQ